MTNKITANLFTNAALTKAFRTSIKNPNQRVVYNGISWKVGSQEFIINNKDKMHSIRACLFKFGHKLRMMCSYQYGKNFKNCIKTFEKAQVQDWPLKVAKEATKVQKNMMKHEYLAKQLPLNIENIIIKIGEKEEEIKKTTADKQQKLFSSDQMKALLSKQELLEVLNGSLDIYMNQRVKKESKEVVVQWTNLWNENLGEYLTIGEAKKLPPELDTLAKEILDPIKLNPQDNNDQTQFKNKIAEEIKNISKQAAKMIDLMDLKNLEEELKFLHNKLKQYQNEEEQAPVIIRKIAQCYDDTTLLPSSPQRLTKVASSHTLTTANSLSGPLRSFLNELETKTSPQMRALWEALLLNLNDKYGQDVVKSFNKKGKTLELIFNQPIKIYMLACDDKGREKPTCEPEGGSVLILGDENRKLTFSANEKNVLNITGLSSWARIPNRIADTLPKLLLNLVGEYTQVQLPLMKIQQNQLIITAYKKVMLTEKRIPRSTPIAALKKHWRQHGERVPLNKTEEEFLKEKRAHLIRRKILSS